MSSCLNEVQGTGAEVDFVIGGYTACVQIMDKGINRPLKGYSRDNFKRWMMTNDNGRYPTRSEVPSWTTGAWDKCTLSCIKNNWRSAGHFVPGEYVDPAITTSAEAVSFPPFPPIFGVSHDDIEEDDIVEDEGGGYTLLLSHGKHIGC
jgi:hypothetical protein